MKKTNQKKLEPKIWCPICEEFNCRPSVAEREFEPSEQDQDCIICEVLDHDVATGLIREKERQRIVEEIGGMKKSQNEMAMAILREEAGTFAGKNWYNQALNDVLAKLKKI